MGSRATLRLFQTVFTIPQEELRGDSGQRSCAVDEAMKPAYEADLMAKRVPALNNLTM